MEAYKSQPDSIWVRTKKMVPPQGSKALEAHQTGHTEVIWLALVLRCLAASSLGQGSVSRLQERFSTLGQSQTLRGPRGDDWISV